MAYFSRITTTLLVLSGLNACDHDKALDTTTGEVNPEYLQQTWFVSYEEDDDPADSTSIYRPAGFDFPPSRGRTGFTILKDQAAGFQLIIHHGIAPADGYVHSVGHWEIINDNELRMGYPDVCSSSSINGRVVISEIVELTDDVLRLKFKSQKEY